MNKKLLIGIASLSLSPLAFASGDLGYAPASAVDSWNPGVYIGLQAGYGMTGWNEALSDIRGVDVENSDAFAGRVYLGYDFHKNFAIEAGYTQFFNSPKIDGFDAFGNTYAIDLMGKIKANVIDNFGLYAKLGAAYLHTNGDGADAVDNINVAYGAGAFYDITPNISADLSWTRFNGNSSFGDENYQPSADLFALGIMYKFNM